LDQAQGYQGRKRKKKKAKAGHLLLLGFPISFLALFKPGREQEKKRPERAITSTRNDMLQKDNLTAFVFFFKYEYTRCRLTALQDGSDTNPQFALWHIFAHPCGHGEDVHGA
jgi:hypothetical protein